MKQNFYRRNQKFVNSVIYVLVFITTFIFSFNVVLKPLDEVEYQMCEQIARDVFEQKNQVIVEVPDDYSVELTETSITVRSSNLFNRGSVIAKLYNNELVMVRTSEVAIGIIMSILLSTLVLCLLYLITCLKKRK